MNGCNNKMELLGSASIPKALMALGVPIMIGMLINALGKGKKGFLLGACRQGIFYGITDS